MSKSYLAARLAALWLSVPAFCAADNLLQDPGFETGTDTKTFHPAWIAFGNVYHEPVTPRSGNGSCKLFGRFAGKQSYSGIYQGVGATPGARFTASAYLRHNGNDRLIGENKCWVQLEFYDVNEEQLATASSEAITADTPADAYALYSTEAVTAPAKTASVRFVILFEQQEDNAPGAVFSDDTALDLGD